MSARKLFDRLLCGGCEGRANVLRPCGNCGGDGLTPLGRQLEKVGPELGAFVERMAAALISAPLDAVERATMRWETELHLMHEAEALVGAVESLRDVQMLNAPTEHALGLVREQAAALAVQALVVVSVCELMIPGTEPTLPRGNHGNHLHRRPRVPRG